MANILYKERIDKILKERQKIEDLKENIEDVKSSKKYYQIGYKGFTTFITPFIKGDYKIGLNLFETFKYQEVFKINLSSIDLEKLNRKDLFYKNNLNQGDIKISFIRLGDFISNVKSFPTYKMYIDVLYNQYAREFKIDYLNNLIVLREQLNNDDKTNSIYCNRIAYNTILMILERNNVNWSKKSDKLKRIKKYSYTSYDDIDKIVARENFLTSIKELKIELEDINQLIDKFHKKFDIYDNKPYHKLIDRKQEVIDRLEDINHKLIDMDKKEDSFLSNSIGEKRNLSLRLKTYI